MKKLIAILLLITMLSLVGCKVSKERLEVSDTPTQEVSVEESSDDLNKELDEISDLDEELDTSDLDSLDSDLDNLNW